MRMRIDISEVEARTKIRAKYLRAIENEEWDLLPGPVYAKSFLRTYGDYLGIDSRMLIDEYKRRYEGPTDHDVRPIARGRERDRGPRGPLIPPWVVITVVLVGVVVALAVIGSGGNKTTPPATTNAGNTQHHHRRHHRHHKVAPPATPKTVTLKLTPTGTVYVCLVNGSCTKLIPGQIFSAGQTIPTETAP